jgi:hypothetical protein
MIVCTVHEPPSAPADRLDRAEAVVFVRDGFSLFATLFGPLWLLFNGLWLAAALAVGIFAAGIAAFVIAGLGPAWGLILLLTLHLVIGFEGRNIKRWTLARRGWSQLGSVSGRNLADCERRFFEAWLPRQPFITSSGVMAATPPLYPASATATDSAPRRSWWRCMLGRG